LVNLPERKGLNKAEGLKEAELEEFVGAGKLD
jgi:hypothetical protein